MAASNAIAGFGVILKRNSTAIAEITDVKGPKLSRKSIDVTHHQSPEWWAEKIKGMKEAGSVGFSINYIPTETTHNATTGLLSDFALDNSINTWSIVFPDALGTTWSFKGILVGFEPTAPVDDKLSADIEIEIAGKPTLA